MSPCSDSLDGLALSRATRSIGQPSAFQSLVLDDVPSSRGDISCVSRVQIPWRLGGDSISSHTPLSVDAQLIRFWREIHDPLIRVSPGVTHRRSRRTLTAKERGWGWLLARPRLGSTGTGLAVTAVLHVSGWPLAIAVIAAITAATKRRRQENPLAVPRRPKRGHPRLAPRWPAVALPGDTRLIYGLKLPSTA